MQDVSELLNTLDEDNSFTFYEANAGEHIVIGSPHENNILFILKGKIKVYTTEEEEDKILITNYMYNISRNGGPCEGLVQQKTIYIILRSQTLIPFSDLMVLRKIKHNTEYEAKEFAALEMNKMFRILLTNIIVYKKEDISSKYLYDLKKQEFLFLLRRFYSSSQLAQFFLASASCYSEFRIEVLSKFKNSSTAKQLASECHMTTKTFTNHFKEEFNTTPHRWMIQQKISNLHRDILNRSFSVNGILNEYGFSSVGELNKFCTRYKLDKILSILRP